MINSERKLSLLHFVLSRKRFSHLLFLLLLDTLIKLSPIILWSITIILTGVSSIRCHIFLILLFQRNKFLFQKSRLSNTIPTPLMIFMKFFRQMLTLMIILYTMIELLRLLPCILYTSLLPSLHILVFLTYKLLVILTFLHYLIQMVLLVLYRFL